MATPPSEVYNLTNPTPELKPLVSVKQMAEYFQCSRAKAYKLCSDHVIPCKHIGRQIRIRREDIISFVSQVDKPQSVSIR